MRKMPNYPGDDGSDHDVDLSVKQILLIALAGMIGGVAFLAALCVEGAGRLVRR